MLRKLLLATLATVALANVASAADMPVRMATKAVPVPVPYVQMFNWTGFSSAPTSATAGAVLATTSISAPT